MTVISFTATGRSSSLVDDVSVKGVVELTGSSPGYSVPVPSSLIVAVPVAAVPPVLLALSVKVSPSSETVSLVIVVRTRRSPPLSSATVVPAV